MAEEHYPEGLLYHREHDWVRMDGDIATFGITWFAQDLLGEIVFWEAPQVGVTVTKDESYADLESVKAVTDVIAPLSGEIIEINPELAGNPALVNDSPYEQGWLVRVRPMDLSEREALLDAVAYRGLL
jgi:glycine cleavage system H protein